MLDRSLNILTEPPIFGREDGAPAGWAVSTRQVPYPEAVAAMEARAAAIAEGSAGELVWLLEHPPLYTAGVSSKESDLLDPGRFPGVRQRPGAASSPITGRASGWPM
jgi:lipoyl(octanoyl) transferase